ncbi:MAG: CorA family divalent cation transporter [Rothia dentocariosa]
MQRQFRNIQDHVVQVKERLEDLRTSLQNTLTVHDTIVAQQQNEDMKRISAGAAILVVPTIIGSIYGMNFEDMPELKWTYGYPASLVLMVVACVVVYLFFKKRGWF